MENNKKKVIYLECIRIISIFFVVFNHTNQHGFFFFPNTDNVIWYLLSIFFSVLCKSAVPLFFMISGFLLLGKQETLITVLKNRVLKYGFIILIASAFTYIANGIYYGNTDFSIRDIIKIVYRGSDIGTYWFLYSYLGILLMLPFLRGCVQYLTKMNTYYLILLRIVIIGLLPIVIFVCLGYSMETKIGSPVLQQAVFYCLIGYYFGISDNEFKKKKVRIVGMLLSLLAIAISAAMTYYEFIRSGEYSESFLEGLLPIVCITIFGTVRYYSEKIKENSRIWKLISFVGDKTFGVYLLEPVLRTYGQGIWNNLLLVLPDFVASIVWCVIFVATGIVITAIIKLIPGVRKML